MKRFLTASIAALVLVSCGKQDDPSKKKDETVVDVSVSVTLDAEGLEWSRASSITVFSADRRFSETFESSDKGETVVFNGRGRKCDEALYLISPSDGAATIKNGVIRTAVPLRQSGTQDEALIFGKSSDGKNFTAGLASALLRFSLPVASNITSVRLSSPDGPLSGEVRVECSKGRLSGSDAAGDVLLSGLDPKQAGTYWLSVIPDENTEFLEIRVNGSSERDRIAIPGGLSCGVHDLGTIGVKDTGHPRVMWLKGEEQKVLDAISSNYYIKILHRKIMEQADKFVDAVPLEYEKSAGENNILYVCRAAFLRITSLAYAFRMTGEEKYLKAAVNNLETVCGFPDWNPAHFLDTGEMCAAVGLGYDWLYDHLDTKTRSLCEQTIQSFGFAPYSSGKYSRSYYKKNTNWNQVCSGGITIAALALEPLLPDVCKPIIADLMESVKVSVDGYDPDGTYPEGTGYWNYGSNYNAMMYCALESCGYTPYYGGKGFAETSKFYLHVKGPSGNLYDYSDGGSGSDVDVAPFWFAHHLGTNDPLWWELKSIDNGFQQSNYYLPIVMVFAKELNLADVQPPASLTWYGGGITPVFCTRTSWRDANASWLGIKGGKAGSSHSHMDGGSFVFEALGERWVIDQGGESYSALTSHGIDQGNLGQSSPRWDVLKYSPASHSTIRLNGERHMVVGTADIKSVVDEKDRQGVVMDLTKLYEEVNSVTREAVLASNGVLTVVDRVNPKNAVRYTATLPVLKDTEIEIVSGNEVILHRGSKWLKVIVSCSDAHIAFSASQRRIKADNDYESADSRAVDFECNMPSASETAVTFNLVPAGALDDKDDISGGAGGYGNEQYNW